MGRREEATAFILKHVQKLTPGDKRNVELLGAELSKMSDEEFGVYMEKLSRPYDIDGEWLPLTMPTLDAGPGKLSTYRNIQIAKKLGEPLFQHVWYKDPLTGDMVLSRRPAMIVDMPVRRQAQLQETKESMPLHDRVRDELSNQVTGESKGAKLSFPELQAMTSQGLDEPIIEMAKVRGGDEAALREMTRQLTQTGACNLDLLMQLGSRPKSADTLRALLLGMHYDTNL